MHDHRISVGPRFSLELQRVSSWTDQKTSFGARVLNGGAHEPIDQLLEHHLARDNLRDFDDGREIEELNGRDDRAPRSVSRRIFLQVGIQQVELPNLAVRSPREISVPSLP